MELMMVHHAVFVATSRRPGARSSYKTIELQTESLASSVATEVGGQGPVPQMPPLVRLLRLIAK